LGEGQVEAVCQIWSWSDCLLPSWQFTVDTFSYIVTFS